MRVKLSLLIEHLKECIILQLVLRKIKIQVIIAGAGGSAHLPGMVAALTSIPVIGVPIESKKLKGLDSLLSIAQMLKGIPVGTVAIGKDGAINAALLAASIIGLSDKKIKFKLDLWRNKQTKLLRKTSLICQLLLLELLVEASLEACWSQQKN